MSTWVDRPVVEGTVTLLFTDLVGSTELLSRIGDDAAEGVRRAHFRLLRDAVTARGGHEVKNLGDGLMVAFLSAADAVRCAVDMQQAVARHNRRATEVKLSVRVGLHVGEPVRDEDDYFGTPVVVAQRLCDAAEGGQIIASDLVRALVGSGAGVEYDELGPLALKGLADPVVAWAVISGDVASPLVVPAALLTDSDAPFVNRTDELRQLRDLWDAACGGTRQVAFVVGEPGIGKTRLCAEIARTATASGVVLYGRSDEETLVPYQPFIEALRPYLSALTEAVLTTELGIDAVHAAKLMPELAERLAASNGDASDDPATERYRLFEAVVAILDHAAAAAPVLLVLDDLHWADKPTVLLLRHLVRSVRAQRVFILATYRDSEVTADRPLGAALADLRRDHRYERLRLGGLGLTDMGALTGEWDDTEVARLVGRAVFDETEGNPFFVAETLRHLADSGAIRREDGKWVVAADASDLSIPEGVREVLSRRLGRLSDAARRVLAVAAVMGPEFDLPTLADVVDVDEIGVLDILDEGLAAQVIVEAPDTVDRYAFSHALIRRTLCDDMSTTRRVRLHRRIAEALENRGDRHDDRQLAQLAFHYGEAAVAGDGGKAVTYALAAGARAVELIAYEEAVDHFASALQAIDFAVADASGAALVAQRNDVLLALGDAEWRAGELARARQRFAEAAESAQRIGRADQLARAALAYGIGFGGYGQAVRSDTVLVNLLEQALAAVAEDEVALRTRLLGRLAAELYYTDEVERRARLADEAVALARGLDDPAILGVALISREAATFGPDRPPEDRLAACDEIIDLSQRSGERQLGLEARSLRIDALIVKGDIAAADEEHRLRSREAEVLRIPQYLSDVFTYPSARALLVGDFAEAQRLADHTIETADPLYTETTLTLFGAQVICLHWLRGQLEGMAPMVRDFVERFPWIPGFRAAEAFVLAETGDLDDARARVAELAPNRFAAIPRDGIWSIAVWTLASAVTRLDDEPWAGELYDLLFPVADCCLALGGSMYLGPTSTSLGMMADVLGRFDDGVGHFEHALAHTQRIGAHPFRAFAEYGFARLLRRHGGDSERAAALESSARATAERLGMAGLVRDLEKLSQLAD